MPKYKNWFWLAALVAAWLFDFLFWKKPSGISFTLWITFLLAAGYLLAWREGKKPSWLSILLTILIAGFSSVFAWRDESFTRGVSALLSFGGMILLTASFLNGFWPWYRLRDYVVEFSRVIFGGLSGAVLLASKTKSPPALDGSGKSVFRSRVLPILRGILIALPIVAVLGLLLASADPVFGDWVKKVLDLEKLPEYLFRLFYILLIGAFLVGIYLRAIHPSREASRPTPNDPWVKPFLGWTETGIILGAVDLLFITFVVIQIRYLFGGSANISETGYTFAEYARRGFGELVAVAVLSLVLYLGLSSIAKRDSKSSARGFTILSILLMVNVLVILASSFQRLQLYENAYGFSQLRTYTHIFIFWLAGLILATIILELFSRRGHFALVLLACIVGFGITLSVINVDGFIVRRNVDRALAGEELDVNYLNTLSNDSIPVLIERYQDQRLPANIKNGLGTVLACREKVMKDPVSLPWQAYHFGNASIYRQLQEKAPAWAQYRPYLNYINSWVIQYEGEEMLCENFGWMD